MSLLTVSKFFLGVFCRSLFFILRIKFGVTCSNYSLICVHFFGNHSTIYPFYLKGLTSCSSFPRLFSNVSVSSMFL